mmetsp:Transcript_32561/g.59086  ORF Transcript_32561/g.59086 Transcript_32561/m.59086 type:complete len:252 (-) Transcript_32561:56-811(-)
MGALVDGGLLLIKDTGLTLTAANDNIDGVNFVLLELSILDLLVGGGAVEDALAAINDELLHLVGHDTLNKLASIGLNDLLEDRGNIANALAWADQTSSGIEGNAGSLDDVGGLTSDGGITFLDDNGVGNNGSEAINVAAKIDLNNVTVAELSRIFLSGGEMANDTVDRDASGESNTLLNLLALVNLSNKLGHEVVTSATEVDNLGSSLAKRNNKGDGLVGDFGGRLVLGDNIGVAKVGRSLGANAISVRHF